AIFRGIGGGKNFEFLDAVNACAADARFLASQLGADGIHVNAGSVSAVKQHVDAGKGGLKPAEAILAESTGGDRAGHQGDKRGKVAAVEGEIADLVGVDGCACGAALCVNGHRVRGDGNRLAGLAQAQLDIHAAAIRGVQENVGDDFGLESRVLDLHF